MLKPEIYNQFQRPPNVCVLVVPYGEEQVRTQWAIDRAAQACNAIPVETLHLTVQYLFDVDVAGRARLAERLAEVAHAAPPFEVIVMARHTDLRHSPRSMESLILEVVKTAPLRDLYTRLVETARAVGVPPVAMTVNDWTPHVKVFEVLTCNLDEAIALLTHSAAQGQEPTPDLVRDLSFRATALALSYREIATKPLSDWRIEREYPFGRRIE